MSLSFLDKDQSKVNVFSLNLSYRQNGEYCLENGIEIKLLNILEEKYYGFYMPSREKISQRVLVCASLLCEKNMRIIKPSQFKMVKKFSGLENQLTGGIFKPLNVRKLGTNKKKNKQKQSLPYFVFLHDGAVDTSVSTSCKVLLNTDKLLIENKASGSNNRLAYYQLIRLYPGNVVKVQTQKDENHKNIGVNVVRFLVATQEGLKICEEREVSLLQAAMNHKLKPAK